MGEGGGGEVERLGGWGVKRLVDSKFIFSFFVCFLTHIERLILHFCTQNFV